MESEHEKDSQLLNPEPLVLSTEPEPTPEPPAKKPFWGFWATTGFGLAIGAVVSLVAGVVIGGMMLAGVGPEVFQDPFAFQEYLYDNLEANFGYYASIITLISAVLATAAIVGVIKMRRGASVREYLGLRRMSFKTWLLVLLAAAAMIGLMTLFNGFVDQTTNNSFDAQLFNSSVSPVLLGVALVIFAPIHEELIFRGFLFAGWLRSPLEEIGTILLTSLIWALLHIQYDWSAMGMIFVMGLVMGWVRLKTGSLWSTLLIHGVYNLVATLGIAYAVGV